MGVKLERDKNRHWLLSIIYRAQKLLPLGKENKLRLFLDLEWIFDRLSHEASFRNYQPEEHPVRMHSKRFIMQRIDKDKRVLDIGCKHGEIADFIAESAQKVVGIDYDEHAISIARSSFQRENLEFVVGEAYDYLNATEDDFQVLILSHLLEHLDDPQGFLLRFKDFFQLIYIEVPDFDRNYLNHYRKDLKMELIYSDTDHISEFDRIELKALLDSCALEVIDSEYRFGVQKLWCRHSQA